MRGSILIVSRQNLHLTKKCVASALNQDMECDVLVIDNQSSDGTVAWLRTKPVTLIANPKQLSLAACWNMGIRAFWRIGRKDVLSINNDTILRADCYRLLRGMNRPMITAVSVNRMEQVGTPGDRTVEDLQRSIRPHPDMSCFMLSKSVTDKVGWFDEKFDGAYAEDLDFHIRCHKSGVTASCIDLPFYHEAAATLKNADQGEAARIKRKADANRLYFSRKWGVTAGSPEYYALFGT